MAVGEHPSRGLDADGSLFGVLPVAPSGEDTDGGGVEVDTPTGVAGLGLALSRAHRLFARARQTGAKAQEWRHSSARAHLRTAEDKEVDGRVTVIPVARESAS